jgi:hypothetical protein
MSDGITTVATTGFSLLWMASSTPFGSATSRTCSEWPTVRLERSTSMNSGRSSGKQVMSSSFSTWLAMPPCFLHAGRLVGVHEVQRHLHVDLLVLGHALEVDVLHLQLERMHVHRAQQNLLVAAVQLQRQDRGVELLVPQVLEQRLVVELDVSPRHRPRRRRCRAPCPCGADGGSHPFLAPRAFPR